MNVLIFSPPVVFIIAMLLALYFSYLLSKLAFQQKDHPKGQTESYACGENIPDQMVEVDYSQFFPFAFYFTILHVVALMLATVPTVKAATLLIALVYILGAIIGLLVLYRR
jgi:NADH:ubiquinone oxidoreductase subunit 3 (subunit A)